MEALNAFLYGVLATLAFVAGVFFLRYWHVTRDRFFVFMVVTFWSLAANWGSLAGQGSNDHAAVFYLPRLVAFVVLLIGIADKNRRSRKART